MPKNQVSDPITDQEVAFVHLVLSGTMTDRQAAEAAGLNPDTAAYTKAKPRVRAYMLEHRAAVSAQLVQQEADLSRPAVERLQQRNSSRERVLNRLWEIADMSPELTRNSVTGQVKALSMIVAIEGHIPDRRAGSSADKTTAAPSPRPNTYRASWLPERQGETASPRPGPDLQAEDPAPSAADAPTDPRTATTPEVDSHELIPVPPAPETTPSSPYARVPDSAPDHRPLPLHMRMNPFGRRQ